MPIPTFTGLPPQAGFEQVVAKVNTLVKELQNLFLTLDSLNVVSLTADNIDTGTIDAGVVTVRADLAGGAYIRIDGTGLVINDGTQDTLIADTAGNITLKGVIEALSGTIGGFTIGPTKLSGAGIIEGGTLRTAASGERIEISDDKLRSYNSSNNLNGISFGSFSGYNYGDTLFYANGILAAVIDRFLGEWAFHGVGTNSLHLGSAVESDVQADGTWTFNDNLFLTQAATLAIGGTTQADSAAATLPNLVADFNTLLGKLRNMGVLG